MKILKKRKKCKNKYYTLPHKKFDANVGDLVLVRTHILSNKMKGICKKFSLNWSGPFRILHKLSPVSFELCDMDSGDPVGPQNAMNMQLYFDRPSLISFADP